MTMSAMSQQTAAATARRRFGVMIGRFGTTHQIGTKGSKKEEARIVEARPVQELDREHPKAKREVICLHKACKGATAKSFEEMREMHDPHDVLVRDQESHVLLIRATDTVPDADGKPKTVDLGYFSTDALIDGNV